MLIQLHRNLYFRCYVLGNRYRYVRTRLLTACDDLDGAWPYAESLFSSSLPGVSASRMARPLYRMRRHKRMHACRLSPCELVRDHLEQFLFVLSRRERERGHFIQP